MTMKEKDELRRKFSSEPNKYYRVELFDREGFVRKRCPNCGKFFWTLNPNRNYCPDPPCETYGFIANPPTQKRLNYIQSWREVEDFFVKHGHVSITRYPVVCRWRPDLYFTVASIVDFQRVEAGHIVFEFPANPLIVPQMCLRFNDIQNVGISGRHYTSFCMIGQHSITDGNGYWKDECIELDFRLLTNRFGINKEDIVFVEDVWLGYGAFGYSLEYFSKGLELGNAVFTAFEGSPSNYREMEKKVIDMGAGLERFAWITQGTPTSYDCVFGKVMDKLIKVAGVEYDREFWIDYSKTLATIKVDEERFDLNKLRKDVAERMNINVSELEAKIVPLEALYAVADHARSLAFAISDGGLPSNTGGGFNLRVILRRALSLIEKFGWNVKLEDVALWHVDYLKAMYPELNEHKDEIALILSVEEKKYKNTRLRIDKIVSDIIKRRRKLTINDLIRLYDSEGIPPELLKQRGLDVEIPHDFYAKVTERHLIERKERGYEQDEVYQRIKPEIERLDETRQLYYEDNYLKEFDAKVVKVIKNRFIVLDKTAFYPRGGGQEPDFGYIGNYKVKNVEKIANIIVHEVENCSLKEGQVVHCKLDWDRRSRLMKHHTATHIINGSARRVLGSWVWQHSAYKDADKARLDITHFAKLSKEEIKKIEDLANQIVMSNILVNVQELPRREAEKKYGFRLYQGGVVPAKTIRVVAVGDFDIEACGGTHCSTTGEVGLIKIIRTERIQDGVERIEFVAGQAALDYIRQKDEIIKKASSLLEAQPEKLIQAIENLINITQSLKKANRAITKELIDAIVEHINLKAQEVNGVKLYKLIIEPVDEDFYISIGEKVIERVSNLVFVGICSPENRPKVVVFSGKDAIQKGANAGLIAKKVSILLNGSGGGNKRFGRGGGKEMKDVKELQEKIKEVVAKIVVK